MKDKTTTLQNLYDTLKKTEFLSSLLISLF